MPLALIHTVILQSIVDGNISEKKNTEMLKKEIR